MINESEFNLALNNIAKVIIKVLKVNIYTGGFKIVKIDDNELPKSERAKKNIFAWADEFMEDKNTIENSFEIHRLMYNPKYIQEYFSKNDFMNVKYKRKDIDGKYKWIELQINKIDNEWVYLYIIDVNHRFSEELTIVDNNYAEKFIDPETGFKNVNALNDIIERFNNRKVGILYFKIDTKDIHTFVKQAIKTFSYGYYRLSENEFYIICNDYCRQRFNLLSDELKSQLNTLGIQYKSKQLWQDKYTSIRDLLEKMR